MYEENFQRGADSDIVPLLLDAIRIKRIIEGSLLFPNTFLVPFCLGGIMQRHLRSEYQIDKNEPFVQIRISENPDDTEDTFQTLTYEICFQGKLSLPQFVPLALVADKKPGDWIELSLRTYELTLRLKLLNQPNIFEGQRCPVLQGSTLGVDISEMAKGVQEDYYLEPYRKHLFALSEQDI